MPRNRRSPAQGGADPAQIAADVDALMEALEAAGNPRQSPVYQWLDVRHDEIVAKLNGRRMQWKTFAAHLNGLGLSDGHGGAVTATVARNTWDRVRKARLPSMGGDAAHPPAPGARTRTRATRGGGTRPQHADGISAPACAAPAQESGGGSGVPTSSGDYPPGVRVLAVSGPDPELPGEELNPGLEPPKPDFPTAPDQVSPSPLATGRVIVNWIARFPSMPPPNVRTALLKSGGVLDQKSKSWRGSSADDLDSLARFVKAGGGSFETP